jgi:LPXTG-site transpeptidase (sortase) family protein
MHMKLLSLRLGRVVTAVLLACGVLAGAQAAEGVYGIFARRVVEERPLPFARLEEGDLVGRITASRVGLTTPVYEGINAATLAQGPGHVPATNLPGRSAGAVIAISRGDAGDRVARLRMGDSVEMRTPFGLKRYRVAERQVLDAESIRFDAISRGEVTLLTPYPPEEVGPAPSRLVVRLEQ